jgi:hypothetical protein
MICDMSDDRTKGLRLLPPDYRGSCELFGPLARICDAARAAPKRVEEQREQRRGDYL